jgi:hypothetical protein
MGPSARKKRVHQDDKRCEARRITDLADDSESYLLTSLINASTLSSVSRKNVIHRS